MSDEYKIEMLLREVNKIHTNKINAVLDEFNMHKGQPRLLHLLIEHDGVPQSNLSKEMHITPATVSAMVKRMEKRGFVVRKRDAVDERVSNVYITDEGKAMHEKLQSQKFNMENYVFAGFDNKEKEQMEKYLKRILENLNK